MEFLSLGDCSFKDLAGTVSTEEIVRHLELSQIHVFRQKLLGKGCGKVGSFFSQIYQSNMYAGNHIDVQSYHVQEYKKIFLI